MSIIPLPVNVIPLFVFNVKLALVFRVPDPLDTKVMLSTSAEPGTAPKALSPATIKIPADNIFEPVCVLVPDKVNVPAPDLVIVPDPAITPA